MNAMQRFKELSGTSFPSYGDVLKVAVAAILTRFRVALAPNTRIGYKVRIALSPNRNIPATLHRQDGAFAGSSIQGSIRKLVRFPD